MRTAILAVAVGCVVILGALFAVSIAEDEPHAFIAPQVRAEMSSSSDGSAYVIVILEEVPLLSRGELAAHQLVIADLQDRVLANLASNEFEPVYLYKTIAAMTGWVNSAGLDKLAADANVVAIGADIQGSGQLDDSVPFINGDDVHNSYGITGQGITVAVLDTGIDTDNVDLSDNIAAGAWHFLDQGVDQGPGAEDDNGHGSNVSGIITSKGQQASVGVAPDADILAVKVLKFDNSGWLSDWTAGVDYVVLNVGDYDDLCAINMSLGSFTLFSQCPCDGANQFNQALGAAITAAKAVGIITFASSGNQGSCGSMSAPACLTDAVAVAAVYDQDLGREPDAGTYQSNFGTSFGDCYDDPTAGDKITCFSNQSECNELAAPGRLITSCWPFGGLSTYTGTSQASPHAAGVAALMCECAVNENVNLTPQLIRQVLSSTGVNTDNPCGQSPNPKRVDALAAVTWVKTLPVFVTSFTATPVGGNVALQWEVVADEPVAGFRVYRRNGDAESETVIAGALTADARSYVDEDVLPGRTYIYALGAFTPDGREFRSQPSEVTSLALAAELGQNYPNPFNPSTTIEYTLPEASHIRLAIFDAQGRLIRTLENTTRPAGPGRAEWDGRDKAGNPVGSGVYFYRLEAGDKTLANKMILLK